MDSAWTQWPIARAYKSGALNHPLLAIVDPELASFITAMGADTLQIVKLSLQGLAFTVKAVPIPEPFKSAVVGIPDAVLQIITIVETAKGNVEDAKALAVFIATTADRTIRPLDFPHVAPATQNRIHKFHDTLWHIADDIKTFASQRPLWKRIVNYDRDASTLASLKQKVSDAITGIQLESVVATAHEVELIYQEQQDLIRKLQEAEIDRLIALLGNGDSGSSKKPPCMDGTRLSLLHWITRWIEEPSDDDKHGLCLIGAAGRGKSSVGASIARQERKLKRLGADFYFTVDQQDRNEGVIPVLARQLASWGDGRLRTEIASALHTDRDLAQRLLEVQFKELIQEPLETLANDLDCPILVILLDGLDECDNDYACQLLDLIGQSFAKLPPTIKFIITSRPEPHLLHLYHSSPMDGQLEVRSLDLEKEEEVNGDIDEFFKQKLPRMVWWVKNPSKWPGDERRKALVQLSQGLWMFAATVARMLADQHFRDPEKQLDALLSSAADPHRPYGHNTDLYSIYSKILNRACPSDSPPELLGYFRDVLGALCVLGEPVNIHILSSLLYPNGSNNEGSADGIRTKVLGYLQAVLIVPDVDTDVPSRNSEPIRFIHKSFGDYLTDESRCEARFLVDKGEQNRLMAIRCLRCMEDLRKPNICNIDPTVLTVAHAPFLWSGDPDVEGEIEDLVQQHISSALEYACKNWTTHVSRTSSECDDVYTYVNMFTRTRLLYWLEVLSLLGETHKAIGLVELLEGWLKARSQRPGAWRRLTTTFVTEGLMKMQAGIRLLTNILHVSASTLNNTEHILPDLLPIQYLTAQLRTSTFPTEPNISTLSLLQDLKNLVSEFDIPIRASPPHIYHSALSFTPSHTSLSQVYGHLAVGGLKPRRGCLQQWSQRHEQWCVAWSPDGQKIVSGSSDGTLRVWDLSTGTPIGDTWKSHTGGVKCVSWSPSGKMIVSGSKDHTLRLWNSTTGACIGRAWKGHTKGILSVAWSPDGERVVSGSSDHTLRMWDPTGVPIGDAWKGHIDYVFSVAWSPDGKRIASGSFDQTIRLWDSSTGALVGTPWRANEPVWSLAWSPDGKRIVCGTKLGTLRLWDACVGELVGDAWEGHTRAVFGFAWSPDGKRIVTGSRDNTLRLWDPSTGAPVGNAWQGHTDDVDSLSWSPDGKMIVSASDDGTLILWNSQTGEPVRFGPREANNHSRHVYHIAFAPSSNNIVSASFDGTLRLWDALSGALIRKPVHQTAGVTRLAFSLDSKYVVSEDDECQTIWEVAEEDIGDIDPELRPIPDNHARVLEVDEDGWLRDPGGQRMFWLPLALRPIGHWGRILAYENVLAIEIPSVPIIDISAYASRF